LFSSDELSGSVWHVPFDQRPEFFGRTNELEHLKQKIFETDGRRVAVLGLGGVGKSRLALELVDRIHLEHPQHSIFWIQAADQLCLAYQNPSLTSDAVSGAKPPSR